MRRRARSGWLQTGGNVHFFCIPLIDTGTIYSCHPPPPPHHHHHLVNKGQAIRHLEGQLICHPSTNVSESDLVRWA